MEEFKELENLWKKAETPAPRPNNNISTIKNNHMKLKHTHTRAGALLVITAILIIIVMLFLDKKLQTTPVTLAMVILSTICVLQATLMFYTAQKLSDIDETQEPTQHLKQWQNFREFQKKQRQWNMPVYYTLLSIAIGVYLYEILQTVETWKMTAAFILTYGWLLFAYFYLGKKEIKKQDAKMDGIISELKELQSQFH